MFKHRLTLLFFIFVSIGMNTPCLLFAHCDTVSGPVIADAKRALETNDLTPVLKWIQKGSEEELNANFQKALAVRSLNAAARDLADNSFFETVVRLHRAGESAPYTGLSTEAPKSIIVEAEKSLQTGSLNDLSEMLTLEIRAQLRQKFQDALDKKKKAGESVEQGREYVEAYISFVHYVEALEPSPGIQEKHSH